MAETPASEPVVVTNPSEVPSKGSTWLAVAGVILGTIYLFNPTAGVFELIPDVIPVVGNLDEAAATTLVVLGLQRLGRFWKKPR